MPGKLRTLYVDDEPDLLEIAQLFLEHTGDFSVETIDSATGALDLLKSEQFDAVIADYQMPGIDGIEFLKAVRSCGNTIPFILFTGKGREEVVIQAINNGADFYLQKGGEPDAQFAELSHKIKQATSRKQAEVALRESEDRFSNAFEYAAIGMALVSPDGRWLKVNQSICEIVGYSENELQAMTFQDITHPDDLDTDLEYVRRMIEGEIHTYQMEKRYFHKSGQLVWALLSVSLVRDNQGKPRYFISQVENITGHKEAEKALRESEEKFRLLAERTNDLIYSMDLAGNITYLSPQISRYGYTPEEIISSGISSIVLAEDLPRVLEDARMTASTGNPTVTVFRIRGKSGATFWMEDNGSAVYDTSGKVSAISGIVRDITERKRGEEALKKSELRVTTLLEHMPLGMIAADSETGRFIFSNETFQRMLGYNHDDIQNFTHADIHPAEDLPIVMTEFNKMMRGEPLYVAALPVKRREGSVFFADIRTTDVELDGRACVLAVFTDVTERKKAEEALLESYDQLTESEEGLRLHQVELETQVEELRRAHLELTEARDKYFDLYEFTPLGYLTLNDSALIEEVNLTGATLLGVERSKLPNARFGKFVTEKENDQWYLYFQQLLAQLDKQVCTLMLKRGDGSTFPARLEGIRIADSSKGNSRIKVTISDITDIWEVEEALKKSEEEYRMLVEKSSDGIWLLDNEFLTVYVNPAMEKMLGYSKDEMTGRSWYSFGDPEWVERAKELENRRESGIGEPHEFLFIHRDGRKVWTRISTTPLYDNDGSFNGALGILSDITWQKQAEE